jgi:prepilin-type N-terminal cleavage/methylation domain-containing protein
MKRTINRKRAFTLVEIMIVVLIIGILMAIAVPNFVKARESSRRQTCIANLKQFDTAKEQWAMDNKKSGSDTVALTDLSGSATAYIKTTPSCPSGGTYAVTTVSASPTCSKSASPDLHVLP